MRLKAHVDAAILAQAFVVEAIHLHRLLIVAPVAYLSNLSALVVSSNQSYSIWIAHLAGSISEPHCTTLRANNRRKVSTSTRGKDVRGVLGSPGAVEASVYEISHEEVVRVRAIATHLNGVRKCPMTLTLKSSTKS